MSKSKWEKYYRRYRSLQSSWRCFGAPKEVEKQMFTQVLTSPKDPEQFASEVVNWGYDKPSAEQWEEALELREVILSLPEGWFVDTPLEDVYQAALRIESYVNWKDEQGHKLFRGQRKHDWETIPLIFRSMRSFAGEEERANYIRAEVKRVRGLVRQLQANGHDVTDEEGVAIVQHYSLEANTATWLIDFTWDPFVALFFASDGGEDEDIGVISYLGVGEWDRFSAGGKNRIGAIRVIEPEGIPRIKAQRAAFVDTSHPDLFEQFVPHSLYFKQKPGVSFKDTTRDPPVARSLMYPDDDPYKEELKRLTPLENASPLSCMPASDAKAALDAEEYVKIVESWCFNDGVSLNDSSKAVLRLVCRVHAELQKHKNEIEITLRSLHRLEEAVLMVREFEGCSLEHAFTFWLNRASHSSARETIERLIQEIKNTNGKSSSGRRLSFT